MHWSIKDARAKLLAICPPKRHRRMLLLIEDAGKLGLRQGSSWGFENQIDVTTRGTVKRCSYMGTELSDLIQETFTSR